MDGEGRRSRAQYDKGRGSRYNRNQHFGRVRRRQRERQQNVVGNGINLTQSTTRHPCGSKSENSHRGNGIVFSHILFGYSVILEPS